MCLASSNGRGDPRGFAQRLADRLNGSPGANGATFNGGGSRTIQRQPKGFLGALLTVAKRQNAARAAARQPGIGQSSGATQPAGMVTGG